MIELLVVIAIIGLLSTLAVVQVKSARRKAKIAKAQHDIDVIATAILTLGVDTNQWPGHQTAGAVNNANGNEICGDGCNFGLADSQAGLVATDGSYVNWGGPYMRSIGLDPWGNEYFFDTDYQVTAAGQPCPAAPCEMAAVVGSYGPDGVGNNQYTSDDIIKILTK